MHKKLHRRGEKREDIGKDNKKNVRQNFSKKWSGPRMPGCSKASNGNPLIFWSTRAQDSRTSSSFFSGYNKNFNGSYRF